MSMRSKQGRLAGVVAGLALAAVPLRGSAQSLQGSIGAVGQAYVREEAPRVVARAGTSMVDQRLARNIGDGCLYVAQVRGPVYESRLADGTTGYSPNLEVRASVNCPWGVSAIRPRRAQGKDLNAEQLERVIERAGEVRTFRAEHDEGRACTYAPDLEIAFGRLAMEGVRGRCDVAVGGGPRPQAGRVQVREDFRRDLENACEYRATLRGWVHATPKARGVREGGSGGEQQQYATDLVVRPEVHCPNVPVERGGIRRIAGRAMSAEDLARVLRERATLDVVRARARCEYQPSFRIAGTRIEGRDVTYACRTRDGELIEAGGVYVEPDVGVVGEEAAPGTVSVFEQ